MGYAISEEAQNAILRIKQEIEAQERLYRPSMLRLYKQMEIYWEGLAGKVFWDSVSQDYLPIPNDSDANGLPLTDPVRTINILRAHGESIIAALSASVPTNRYEPEDPDNSEDISTAKAYTVIADLISIHNEIPLILIKCLFIIFNQGLLFGYTYSKRDREYGVRQVPITDIVEEQKTVQQCPDCGAELPPDAQMQTPDDIVTGAPGQMQPFCPECAQSSGQPSPIQPLPYTYTEPKLVVSDYEDQEKAREIIEAWGPLNVHYPINISDPKDAGYLILSCELDYRLMRSIYPDKADKIEPGQSRQPYETYARRDPKLPQDRDYYTVTVDRIWLRPWMIESNQIGEEQRIELKKTFPNGAYCVFVNDEYMEACDESMDDHWTVTQNPLSRTLHANPLGYQLLDIQDLVTSGINITAQTMEYGIPQTFADPKYIDFQAYGKHRTQVGTVFPLKPGAASQGADSIFHTEKAATLSDEIDKFMERLDQYSQFVSGDFPSIFGGPQQGGSKTLGEYEASRSMALQRLSLSWKMLTQWYANLMGKAVKEYASVLKSDGQDEYTTKQSGNRYLKEWIQVSDLNGKVGRVIPESSEQFPTTWSQKVARFFELLQTNNPQILSMIFTPQNSSFIKDIIGIDTLDIPGEEQRDKQLEEIFELLKAQPIMPPVDQFTGQPMPDPQTGQPLQPQPSIPIEPDVDEDIVHIQVAKAFLVSDFGRALKETNPGGYANVVAHMKQHGQHQDFVMQQQQQAQMMQQMQQKGQENVGNAQSAQPAS